MTSLSPSRRCLPLIAAATVFLTGCGGGGGSTDSTASSPADGQGAKTVTIADYLYEPTRITVAKGATISFANRDSTPHTATSKQSGAFETGSIDSGETGEVTLDETGTFAYYCAFHPFMKGTMVVE